MTIFKRLKRDWQELERSQPGRRFRERYERKQQGKRGPKRMPTLIAGVVLLVVGAVMMPAPGPGLVVVLLGATLLSEESHLVARIMDRGEVLARQIASFAARFWKHASAGARIAVCAVGVALGAGAGWIAYRVLMD